MKTLNECLDEIDTAILSNKTEDINFTISADLIITVLHNLCLLRDVCTRLADQIEILKSMNPPMDSVAGGVLTGYVEVGELLKNGVENE